MATRILIADDHEVLRRGLRTILETEPGWKVCAEASDGREAVEMSRHLKPDVVVLDITMPGLNGLEAARQILKAVPDTEVVILTVHDSEQVVREVLVAGARGYVLKSDAERELVNAVKAACAHRAFFTKKVSDMVLDGYLRANPQADETQVIRERLTPREKEIVQLLAEGKSNKEVAASLEISVKTVEAHRSNVMRKLGFGSLGSLVRYAVRNKIVQA